MKFTFKDRYYPTDGDLSDRAYEVYSNSDSLRIYKRTVTAVDENGNDILDEDGEYIDVDIWAVDFFGDMQVFNSLEEVSEALEEWGDEI